MLARIFAPAAFGTYKQFFLVYGTLYGLAQLGMAESLYYFVPRNPGRTGRYAFNALVTLALAGVGSLALLYAWRAQIAVQLTNTGLADYMVFIGLFLTFMLMSTVLEIVMGASHSWPRSRTQFRPCGVFLLRARSAVQPSRRLPRATALRRWAGAAGRSLA